MGDYNFDDALSYLNIKKETTLKKVVRLHN